MLPRCHSSQLQNRSKYRRKLRWAGFQTGRSVIHMVFFTVYVSKTDLRQNFVVFIRHNDIMSRIIRLFLIAGTDFHRDKHLWAASGTDDPSSFGLVRSSSAAPPVRRMPSEPGALVPISVPNGGCPPGPTNRLIGSLNSRVNRLAFCRQMDGAK